MNGNNILPIVAAGLAAAILMATSPATAETQFWTGKVIVDYKGVDLTTQRGRQQLDRRVDAAIGTLCGQPIFGTREEAEALRECRSEARAAAEPQIQAIVASATTKVATR